jgi:hypothetical protein
VLQTDSAAEIEALDQGMDVLPEDTDLEAAVYQAGEPKQAGGEPLAQQPGGSVVEIEAHSGLGGGGAGAPGTQQGGAASAPGS